MEVLYKMSDYKGKDSNYGSGNGELVVAAGDKLKEKIKTAQHEFNEALRDLDRLKDTADNLYREAADTLQEFSREYESRLDGEDSSSGGIGALVRTILNFGKDPKEAKKQSLRRILNRVVRATEGLNEELGTKVQNYQSKYEELNGLTDKLMDDIETYVIKLGEYEREIEELKLKKKDLEDSLKNSKDAKEQHAIKKELFGLKRRLESMYDERSELLSQYQDSENLLNVLEVTREQSYTVLAEAKKMHHRVRNNMRTFEPMFDQIGQNADLVEFQSKVVKGIEDLRTVFESALLITSRVAEKTTKLITAKSGQDVVSPDVVKAIEHSKDEQMASIEEGRRMEDKLARRILSGDYQGHRRDPIEEDEILLKETEYGGFIVAEPQKEEEEEKAEE